jgi:trimethylamine:corrinoid methyltransferase-like protein
MDIREQAAIRVKEILSTHYPDYINPEIDRNIRDKFRIEVPRETMQAGNKRW